MGPAKRGHHTRNAEEWEEAARERLNRRNTLP
jgi:hypothetical protein